jgi:hypothetical protein
MQRVFRRREIHGRKRRERTQRGKRGGGRRPADCWK